jgi:hypothetical protein
MSANAWRGTMTDSWGRTSNRPLPIIAGEVAVYRRSSRILFWIGPVLTVVGLVIFVVGMFR